MGKQFPSQDSIGNLYKNKREAPPENWVEAFTLRVKADLTKDPGHNNFAKGFRDGVNWVLNQLEKAATPNELPTEEMHQMDNDPNPEVLQVTLKVFQSGNDECLFDGTFKNQNVIKIGRLQSSHIYLPDTSIARMHAVIEVLKEEVRFIDLGSQTGAFVNHKRVEKNCLIFDGDRIKIGPYQILIGIQNPAIVKATTKPVAKASEVGVKTTTPTLKYELELLLERHAQHISSETPSPILAQYLINCLEAFETATNSRTAQVFSGPLGKTLNER